MGQNIRTRSYEVIKQSAGAPGTMYWVILPVLFIFAEAAKFENRVYLPPPPNWKEAGGRDEDLQVPLEPPYIDPYSDNRHLVPGGGRGFNRGYNPRKELPRSWDGNEDENQIRNFPAELGKPRSRFLYGSYSYTGPDNVLVTVTYTADRKKSKGRRRFYEDDYDDYSGRRYDADDYDYYGPLEGGVVPTPPSLPRELQKAFAFHRKQYQPDNKKDDRKTGKALPTTRQPWSEQPTQKPIIHQGYSYPKANTAKN